MPRSAREKSKTGIYHIMVRGINRQEIFQEEEDKRAYLERLERYKIECGFKLCAYCLMSNHVHLVIKDEKENLPEIMKKLSASYVYWYNWKYARTGHLFQDRYKSEPVENDAYLLTVVRYVHQNPMKIGASMTEWTSYADYINGGGMTDVSFVTSVFSQDAQRAKKAFVEYMNEDNEDKCLDIEKQKKMTDEEAKRFIKRIGKLSNCQEMQALEKAVRDSILRRAKDEGFSVRQLERVTGVNRGAVLKA